MGESLDLPTDALGRGFPCGADTGTSGPGLKRLTIACNGVKPETVPRSRPTGGITGDLGSTHRLARLLPGKVPGIAGQRGGPSLHRGGPFAYATINPKGGGAIDNAQGEVAKRPAFDCRARAVRVSGRPVGGRVAGALPALVRPVGPVHIASMRRAPLLPVFAGRHRQLLQFDAETPPRFNPGSLNVDASDLVRWIEGKNPRAIAHWRDLGSDEYARAFTVARSAGFDIVDDLYFAFADTLERGGTEKDFAKLVVPTLRDKGWLRGDEGAIARRVDLIYDTNLRVARGAGQWDRVQAGKRVLPYLRGATARDERVRHPPRSPYSDHRAWDGIILPVDHPFWTRWWTPLGFRCRCTIIPMTRSQLARFKGGVTSDDDLAEREARLGAPLFVAPGAGVTQQLNAIASAENDAPDRMPGLPLVNVAQERSAGLSLWNSQTSAVLIDTLLDRLFG